MEIINADHSRARGYKDQAFRELSSAGSKANLLIKAFNKKHCCQPVARLAINNKIPRDDGLSVQLLGQGVKY